MIPIQNLHHNGSITLQTTVRCYPNDLYKYKNMYVNIQIWYMFSSSALIRVTSLMHCKNFLTVGQIQDRFIMYFINIWVNKVAKYVAIYFPPFRAQENLVYYSKDELKFRKNTLCKLDHQTSLKIIKVIFINTFFWKILGMC